MSATLGPGYLWLGLRYADDPVSASPNPVGFHDGFFHPLRQIQAIYVQSEVVLSDLLVCPFQDPLGLSGHHEDSAGLQVKVVAVLRGGILKGHLQADHVDGKHLPRG